METLSVLEKKVVSLIEIIKQLKAENARLTEENAQLADKITMMQTVAADEAKRADEFDQEKALTKMVVDDLIKNIDSLIEGETQL
ncbi:MAG TPA: cell division protein ZapB [Candidatus Dependentiae bacterium]|nr:cell division protein ZapB [Candidatus Dependentiae bacterium]